MTSLTSAGFVDIAPSPYCADGTQVANLTVPSKGNVTITASAVIQVYHVNGAEDLVYVYASTSRFGDCSNITGAAEVPASEPNGTYIITVPVALASPVDSAGTYSFAVGASTQTSTVSTVFAGVWGYVVFYPG